MSNSYKVKARGLGSISVINDKILLVLACFILACFILGSGSVEQVLAVDLIDSGIKSTMKIHSVTDISHTFSFYFDGRFAMNYIHPLGGADARNWATLHKCNLSNVNLLVL